MQRSHRVITTPQVPDTILEHVLCVLCGSYSPGNNNKLFTPLATQMSPERSEEEETTFCNLLAQLKLCFHESNHGFLLHTSESCSEHVCLPEIFVRLKLQHALQLNLPFSTSAGGLPRWSHPGYLFFFWGRGGGWCVRRSQPACPFFSLPFSVSVYVCMCLQKTIG